VRGRKNPPNLRFPKSIFLSYSKSEIRKMLRIYCTPCKIMPRSFGGKGRPTRIDKFFWPPERKPGGLTVTGHAMSPVTRCEGAKCDQFCGPTRFAIPCPAGMPGKELPVEYFKQHVANKFYLNFVMIEVGESNDCTAIRIIK
jgi:hypothetical protein